MKISQKCVDLVKKFEADNNPYLTAYKCPAGVWTIGYGTTSADKAVTGKTICSGLKITKETAEEWLTESLNKKYLPLVLKYNRKYNWNQNELDALVSFCYNVGSIKGLTADGTRSKAVIANKMLEYKKGNGKVLPGLVTRRKAERELFLTPVAKMDIFPKLPARGYYQIGDGYEVYKKHDGDIRKLQILLGWYLKKDLIVDGKYGKNTAAYCKEVQKKIGVPVNGKFGKLVLAGIKKKWNEQ